MFIYNYYINVMFFCFFVFFIYIILYSLVYVLPFDYCGNLTTAHSVVKVCAADSQAIPSLHDLSDSLVKLVSELSLIFKSVWQAALCQPRDSMAVE